MATWPLLLSFTGLSRSERHAAYPNRHGARGHAAAEAGVNLMRIHRHSADAIHLWSIAIPD